MNSTILITGGAGFIGSHLCRLYLDKGYRVICVDNLLSGSYDNIKDLESNPDFQFINHDITNPLPQLKARGKRLKAIFHFASPASPDPQSPISYMSHPIKTLMVNSLGTKHMLDLARQHDAQIILASTSEVYGDPLVHPQPETYYGNVSPNGPRSCYDEGKRFLEAIAFSYYRQFQTKIKVIRIFNTYGPYISLRDGRFIPNLIKSYLANKPFYKYADDTTTRSFTYIDDLVKGIDLVFESDKMIGEVVNLGNPEELSLNEAIDIFNSLVNGQIEVIQKPKRKDDPTRRKPDITKARQLLGWEPQIKFKEGIAKTLTWFENER